MTNRGTKNEDACPYKYHSYLCPKHGKRNKNMCVNEPTDCFLPTSDIENELSNRYSRSVWGKRPKTRHSKFSSKGIDTTLPEDEYVLEYWKGKEQEEAKSAPWFYKDTDKYHEEDEEIDFEEQSPVKPN